MLKVNYFQMRHLLLCWKVDDLQLCQTWTDREGVKSDKAEAYI